MSQISTAIIDLRFDQSDRTPDGLLVNGFANVSRVIDRIAETGFTHVTFGVNAPVNVDTGLVDLYDDRPGAYNPNKSLPRDLWQLVDYAKSKGLGVYINPQIVDHTNDYHITGDTRFGAGVSVDRVFQSLSQYFGEVAARAQTHKVDGIYVGGLQHGLVTEGYRSQWQMLVDGVRANFSGQLIHHYFYDGDSVVWDMVDVSSLWIHRILSREPLIAVQDIHREYFSVDSDTPRAVVDVVRDHAQAHNKPVILEHAPINASDRFIGESLTLGQFYETGELLPELSTLNHARQAARHAAFIQLVREDLASDVLGLSISEYAPWQMADWLVDPAKANQLWQVFVSQGSGIQHSPQAEKWISVALNDGDIVNVGVETGVSRVRDLRRAPAIQAQEEDLLDLTGLAQDLDLDLWWSGSRAPGRKEDATGAVWERGNVIYVSTDRDQKAEWWARVVGVRDLDQDDFWLG